MLFYRFLANGDSVIWLDDDEARGTLISAELSEEEMEAQLLRWLQQEQPGVTYDLHSILLTEISDER